MIKIFFLVAMTLFISQVSIADEQINQTESATTENTKLSKSTKIQIGIGADTYNYEEFDVMKENGSMSALSVTAKHRLDENSQLEGKLKYSTGELEYNGHLYNQRTGARTPHKDQDQYTILNLDLNYIHEAKSADMPQLDFGIGLGRRNTIDANDKSKYDYKREITYNYLNYSVGHTFNLSSNVDIDLNLAGSLLISGNVKTDLSDVDSRYPDLDMNYKLGAARSYQIKTNVQYHLDTYSLFASLEYVNWAAGDSEVKQGFVEPKNKTETVAISTGAIF